MPQNKKNLLVTFADRNFIPQVKQLFSSAYHNAGWDGEYMVLTPDMTEEDQEWFKQRGIIVDVKPIPIDTGDLRKFPATIYLIFHLFSEEFKKWQHVLYFDVDVIIRASLEEMTKVSGFAAVSEVFDGKLKEQFRFRHLTTHDYAPSRYLGLSKKEYKSSYKKLKNNFNLNEVGFNAGIFCFNTDIIDEKTFSNLLEISKKYSRIISFPPQGELNLLFYKKWEKLPLIYNSYVFIWNYFYRVPIEKIDGIALHLVQAADKNIKPWDTKSPFFEEWQKNLDLADQINPSNPKNPRKIWDAAEVKIYCDKIKVRKRFAHIYLKLDRAIGVFGIFVKRINPNFYHFLKKIIKGYE